MRLVKARLAHARPGAFSSRQGTDSCHCLHENSQFAKTCHAYFFRFERVLGSTPIKATVHQQVPRLRNLLAAIYAKRSLYKLRPLHPLCIVTGSEQMRQFGQNIVDSQCWLGQRKLVRDTK